MTTLLEVCVDSLASARAAILGGADRLELCSALAAGGLTPYTALLDQIRAESTIPIRCLMRPRAGDFLYTPEEIAMMASQMAQLRAHGADGFVIGCLRPDGTLDEAALAPLLQAAGDAGLTLHRCMDVSRDLEETYRTARRLGFDTVLTSGGAASCREGADAIGRLLALREELGGPEVLIGAGVNAAVIRELRRLHPQACQFHMSGKKEVESGMVFRRAGVPMGLPGLDEWHIHETDVQAVRAAKDTLLNL